MKNFDYCVPTRVIFGRDTHLGVGEIIKSYGFKKALLVYGQGSIKANGLYGEITGSLDQHGVEFTELGGVEPNPKLSFVRKGVEACRQSACDIILAAGGGSVIDAAKHIAVSVPSDADPWEFSSRKRVPQAALPVGVVLTLAASGSETSSSLVMTNEDGQLKRGFNSELLRPLFSILNPELTYSANTYQTGCGIADIMMHSLERYFSGDESTELTDRLAEGLLKSVISAGRTALSDLHNYEARATLMWAGSLSHNDLTGLGRSTFSVCHKLEHELSGLYDSVAHGAGLAAIFPAWARHVYKSNADRFCQYACRVWGLDFTGVDSTALAGIKATEDYFQAIGMPVRLSEFNLGELRIEEMAEKCVGAGELPGHMPLGKKDIIEIFKMAE